MPVICSEEIFRQTKNISNNSNTLIMASQTQKNEGQIAGRIMEILMPKKISEKTTLRELVMEVWDGNYSNPFVFTAKNDRMKQIEQFKVNDWVIVTYKFTGRKVQREGEIARYYNSVEILTIIKG